MAEIKQLLPLPIVHVKHPSPRRKNEKVIDCVGHLDECRIEATLSHRENVEDTLVFGSVYSSTEVVDEFALILVLCRIILNFLRSPDKYRA